MEGTIEKGLVSSHLMRVDSCSSAFMANSLSLSLAHQSSKISILTLISYHVDDYNPRCSSMRRYVAPLNSHGCFLFP